MNSKIAIIHLQYLLIHGQSYFMYTLPTARFIDEMMLGEVICFYIVREPNNKCHTILFCGKEARAQ